MRRHIAQSLKDERLILKKVGDFVPLSYFRRYIQNTTFGLNKVLGSDGTINSSRGIYIIALNIQDIHTNVGYDFVTHISNMTHSEIIYVQ